MMDDAAGEAFEETRGESEEMPSEGMARHARDGDPKDGAIDKPARTKAESPDALPPATAKPEPVKSRPVTPKPVTPELGDPSAPLRAPAANSSRIDFSIPTLRHFATYTRVQHTLEAYVVNALAENRRLDHIVLHGRPGSGTTLLARALVRDYAPARVEELDALGGLPAPKLRRALLRANRRGVVLIRHIELLDPECDQIVANYMAGKPMTRSEESGPGMRMPWESPRDREIAESARAGHRPADSQPLLHPGGTVIGTALLPARMSYALRNAFEQMIHLRNDPKALRAALARVLRPHGITLSETCFRRTERVLGTLTDGTEALAKAVLSRAQLERVQVIDDALMQSIVEEDLPTRLVDAQYASALRDHLRGGKVKGATDDDIARISTETGWGVTAVQAAVTTILREDRARKRPDQSPA
jgi:hypothetical protein